MLDTLDSFFFLPENLGSADLNHKTWIMNHPGLNIMAHLRNRDKLDQNSQLLPTNERRKQVQPKRGYLKLTCDADAAVKSRRMWMI